MAFTALSPPDERKEFQKELAQQECGYGLLVYDEHQ
jgi:hypothetical protein